jgi:hypothetical protein
MVLSLLEDSFSGKDVQRLYRKVSQSQRKGDINEDNRKYEKRYLLSKGE